MNISCIATIEWLHATQYTVQKFSHKDENTNEQKNQLY